jgi:hypothetical protein
MSPQHSVCFYIGSSSHERSRKLTAETLYLNNRLIKEGAHQHNLQFLLNQSLYADDELTRKPSRTKNFLKGTKPMMDLLMNLTWPVVFAVEVTFIIWMWPKG